MYGLGGPEEVCTAVPVFSSHLFNLATTKLHIQNLLKQDHSCLTLTIPSSTSFNVAILIFKWFKQLHSNYSKA